MIATARRALSIAAAAAVLTLAGCCLVPGLGAGPASDPTATNATAGPSAAAPADLHVAPGGTGDCSTGSPCSLARALQLAGAGDRVALAGGDYGEVKLASSTRLAALTANVELVSDPAAPASFARLDSSAAHLSWSGILVTGPFFLRAGAAGSVVDGIRVEGSGIFLRGPDITIRDSALEGGSSIDGIQVGGADRAVIEGNTIRSYDQDRNDGLHSDCIQIFDSTGIAIRANRLANCYDAGVIVSGGGRGVKGLTIESNFIQGCVMKSAQCGGGSAMELREPSLTGLVLRNNTIVNGSVRFGDHADAVVDRNIVGYLSDCDSRMTNSVIEDWNRKVCTQPAAAGADGNRTGTVAFRDQADGDLHLADPETARITPVDGEPAASIDGPRMPADLAGAST